MRFYNQTLSNTVFGITYLTPTHIHKNLKKFWFIDAMFNKRNYLWGVGIILSKLMIDL